MSNERITEGVVRNHFMNDPLYDVIKVEEQRSSVALAKKCLSQASKRGTNNAGFPDFIITFQALPNDVVVIECKANQTFHQSKNGDQPALYALDGIKHYAKFLSNEFNVIGIAVSGTSQKLLVSSIYQKRGHTEYSIEDTQLLSIYSYISKFKNEHYAESIETEELTKLAIELNEELNDYSIVEYERCTLVSAILLALHDESFRKSFESQSSTIELAPKPQRLSKFIVDAIRRVLEDRKIDKDRVSTMVAEYQSIQNKSLAKESRVKKKKASSYHDNFVIRDIAKRLNSKVLPLMRSE